MELKAGMFSTADGQVQAGRVQFWQQQELLLTPQQQVLQAGLAGHWKVTLVCTIVSPLLFPSPPDLSNSSTSSTHPNRAVLTEPVHPCRSHSSKASSVGDKYVLNVKHRHEGSVWIRMPNPISKNANLKVERRVEAFPTLKQQQDTAAITTLCMGAPCRTHTHLGHQFGTRISYLELFRSFLRIRLHWYPGDFMENSYFVLILGFFLTMVTKWSLCER